MHMQGKEQGTVDPQRTQAWDPHADSFSKYTGKHFGELKQFEKALKPQSLKIQNFFLKLGMPWMHKIYADMHILTLKNVLINHLQYQ